MGTDDSGGTEDAVGTKGTEGVLHNYTCVVFLYSVHEQLKSMRIKSSGQRNLFFNFSFFILLPSQEVERERERRNSPVVCSSLLRYRCEC